MEILSRTAVSLLSLSVAFAGTASAVESFRKPTVAFEAGNGTLLASKTSPVSIHADAADWPGVLRAAHDLAIDFGRVTGTNGSLMTTGTGTANASMIFNVTGINSDWTIGAANSTGYPTTGAGTIIVGTIGNSSLIDGMIASGKLDVSAIEGQWESYISTFVENVGNGTGSALVIAGKLIPSTQNSKMLTLRRKRPSRIHLRHLRCLRADRCLAMVLDG
jgi:hypothetical protein